MTPHEKDIELIRTALGLASEMITFTASAQDTAVLAHVRTTAQTALEALSRIASAVDEKKPAVFYCENGKNLECLEQGALAVLSNLMIKTNADTAEFTIGNDKDCEFQFSCRRLNASHTGGKTE